MSASASAPSILPMSDHGLGLAELRLAAREDQAWQRHAAHPSPSTLATYLAEYCA